MKTSSILVYETRELNVGSVTRENPPLAYLLLHIPSFMRLEYSVQKGGKDGGVGRFAK